MLYPSELRAHSGIDSFSVRPAARFAQSATRCLRLDRHTSPHQRPFRAVTLIDRHAVLPISAEIAIVPKCSVACGLWL